MLRRSRLAGVGLAIAAVGLTLPALAVGSPRSSFEINLTADPHHFDGEPSVAVNPVNPKNMIVIYLVNNDAQGPALFHADPPLPPSTRDVEQYIQGCNYAVTFDGGKTWSHHPLPANDFASDPVQSNCSDSIVTFDRRGVAFVMASAFAGLAFPADGEYRLISSRDGGRTWSKPGIVAPGMVGQGSHPATYGSVRTYDDRPWLALDQDDHALYIDGTQLRAGASGLSTVYITASTDGGKTFSDPITVDSLGAKPLGSAPLGAAFGVAALTVGPPQFGGTGQCTCLDFLYTTDHAKTLNRIHTPIPSAGNQAQTVADPSRRGAFAVMTSDSVGRVLIYRTSDLGKTWRGPAAVGVPQTSVVKPWLGFSPQGVLGVGWRAQHSDGTYDFWAAVSYDHGKTLSRLTKISRASSPKSDPYNIGGDDTSSIAISATTLYAAWGDWRGGLADIWFGGLSLQR